MHVREGALPVYQQILLDLLVPPLGAAAWWVLSRGWAYGVQGGNPTARSLKWTNGGFWIVLGLAYCLMFGVTIYGWLT